MLAVKLIKQDRYPVVCKQTTYLKIYAYIGIHVLQNCMHSTLARLMKISFYA